MDEKSIRIQEEALGRTEGPDDHVTQKGSGLEVSTDPRDLETCSLSRASPSIGTSSRKVVVGKFGRDQTSSRIVACGFSYRRG